MSGSYRSITSVVTASVVALLLTSAAASAAPLTTMANVSSSGEQARSRGSTLGGLSRDGRYVVFASGAENLVRGDTNDVRDVFVHDRETRRTRRVSVSSRGHQGNRSSGWARISADARHVVFRSFADNLVRRDNNRHRDIFVHDLDTGRTTCASVSSAGAQADANSNFPDISGDGRFVVFNTLATNIGGPRANDGPGTAMNVYLHDRWTHRTVLASRDPWHGTPHDYSGSASISDDGARVAYTARSGATYGAFVYDAEHRITRAYGTAAGDPRSGRFASAGTISATGRFLATYEEDERERYTTFVHDLATGEVDRLPDGVGAYTLSADGRLIGTSSAAVDLVPGDTNGRSDTFVFDRATRKATRLSVGPAGEQAGARSFSAFVSDDGRFAAFESSAAKLVAGDTNHARDIFVRGPLGEEAP